MRVYVYAIAKDEERHAERFMVSVSEADGVYVLDTGSRDGTAEALRALGAHVTVKEIVIPHRTGSQTYKIHTLSKNYQ